MKQGARYLDGSLQGLIQFQNKKNRAGHRYRADIEVLESFKQAAS